MKKRFMLIEESLEDFRESGTRGIDSSDDWDLEDDDLDSPDSTDVDTSDMENVEYLDIDDEKDDSELILALNNELKIPEFNRASLMFRTSGNLNTVYLGVPMAKIGENAFLFKLEDGTLKKFYIKDIILERAKGLMTAKKVFENKKLR